MKSPKRKEIIMEDAVLVALPRNRTDEFEVDYSKLIGELQEAPIRTKAQIIRDILGDVSDEWPFDAFATFLDGYLDS